MRTHSVQGGGGGGQKFADFCVRTLWMAPNLVLKIMRKSCEASSKQFLQIILQIHHISSK